ncbi:hypothetical protein AB0K21_40070 [Streptosporangium sp. NPDC049248]|uniref:hypothetical protein n=1 Tax=Streptosporangium sp. NPDC049248 TaxID=3155651 RepID=UPI00344080EC
MPFSEGAVLLCRELVDLNRDAYLPNYVQSLATRGYVLVEGRLFRDATAPLAEALLASLELPEYAQNIIGLIGELLRRAYAGDAGVAEEFRIVTGQDFPVLLKEPPSATES